MPNTLLMGLIMTALLGSGAVFGFTAVSGHMQMHSFMHGGSNGDCDHHDDCNYSHEECEEYHPDECEYESQDCYQERGHMGRGC